MEPNELLQEIRDDVKAKWDMTVVSAEPIRRGLLNEKWKLVTDKGDWFVKSYHPERYGKNGPGIWREIEQALRLQSVFRGAGGLAPDIVSVDGSHIQTLPSGRKYIVMEFCAGDVVEAGKVNDRQMRSLGETAALMHSAWNGRAAAGGQNNDGTAHAALSPPEQPLWRISKQQMQETWQDRWEKARHGSSETVRYALRLQKDVMETLDEREFANGTPGWTHLDLWVDNLLFHRDSLSAIVDFDRVRYAFPLLDLGRAVLSCTLHDGTFRRDEAAAFAEGYRKRRELPKGELLRAVRYTWCIESQWWLRPAFDTMSPNPRRFASEMIWTAEQWDRLETLLGDL